MNTKQEVLENLLFADQYMEAMFPNVKKLTLVITGGASFLLKDFKDKVTLDIDTISELDEDMLLYLESFSINNGASAVTYLSNSYQERLEKVKGNFKVLDVYVLSNEDLVISKIGRLSDDDLRDIHYTGIMDKVDFHLLSKLAEEISAKHRDFTYKWKYFLNYFGLTEEVA